MNAQIATPQEPIRTAPLALWRIAAAFLGVLHTMFGPPETIAAKGALTHKPYALLLSWLRCGEALMRRLLLLEAQAYSKPNTRPLLRVARKRVLKPVSFAADAPETWRVSFRCFSSSPARGGSVSARPVRRSPQGEGGSAMTMGAHQAQSSEDRARAAPSVACGDTSPVCGGGKRKRLSREERWCSEYWPKPRFHNAWPIAERYEALLRVFNDPTGYARRLSRRLHATPHRIVELRRAPPEAEHRIENFTGFLSPEPQPPPHKDSS